MNRSEFKTELKERLGNETANQYEEFCGYQDMIWDILVWVKSCFENNGIHYQLAHGSLLGLIRDQGQIPWDYDVDLFVPFIEREKLVTLLNKSLPQKYYYVSYDLNPKYYDTLLRIVPKGFNEAFFHLDIFFMIGTASDIEESESHREDIYSTFFKRYYKLFNPYLAANGRIKSTLRLTLIKARSQFYSIDSLNKQLIDLATRYSFENSEYITTLDQWTKTRRFPNKILNTILYNVGDETYRIPESYEDILMQLYGDYRIVPPFSSRANEFITHLSRIKKYSKI